MGSTRTAPMGSAGTVLQGLDAQPLSDLTHRTLPLWGSVASVLPPVQMTLPGKMNTAVITYLKELP